MHIEEGAAPPASGGGATAKPPKYNAGKIQRRCKVCGRKTINCCEWCDWGALCSRVPLPGVAAAGRSTCTRKWSTALTPVTLSQSLSRARRCRPAKNRTACPTFFRMLLNQVKFAVYLFLLAKGLYKMPICRARSRTQVKSIPIPVTKAVKNSRVSYFIGRPTNPITTRFYLPPLFKPMPLPVRPSY
jgi:hypothetical protein